MLVPQIRFVFFQRTFFNEGAKVNEFLRPFISQFDHEKDHSAKNCDRHVDSVPGRSRIFSAAQDSTTVTDDAIRMAVFMVPTGTFSKPCGQSPGAASRRKKM